MATINAKPEMSKMMKDDAKMMPSTTMTMSMHEGTICHVEFCSPDMMKAKTFYTEMFGWEFHPHGTNEMYFQTPKNSGPCGMMMQGKPAMDCKTMIFVNCDDMGMMMAKAKKLGATMMKDRTEIQGGHGFYAHMKAPDGNVWGLFCKK
jgi:predicted enzyme related to lactoylglutathione lyase